jgi:hypothetical protein
MMMTIMMLLMTSITADHEAELVALDTGAASQLVATEKLMEEIRAFGRVPKQVRSESGAKVWTTWCSRSAKFVLGRGRKAGRLPRLQPMRMALGRAAASRGDFATGDAVLRRE